MPLVRPVLLGVDAVVDHLDPLRLDRRIAGEHVAPHPLRDRDDRVGRLERGPLAEGGERVAAAELLGLPRAQRLEAVHRRDVRDPVEQPRQVPGEVRVPRVAVDELGALDAGGHRQVDRHRLQRGPVRLRAVERVPGPVADGRRVAVGAVGAPAVDGHLLEPGELAREVLDVHAGAAVDLGRVLAREQRDPHARPSTVSPLAITTMPPGETTKRSRSASGSTPTCAPGGDPHVLVDDRVPDDRAAADVDVVHQDRALDLAAGVQVHPGREDRAAHGRARDDHAGAHHRVERVARAALVLEDELGRRQRLGPGQDRPLAVVEVEDRVDRDQVHVRVVVRVQRSDVAPVAALALGRARHDVRGEVVDLRLAALDEGRDEVAADVVARGLVGGVGRDGVDENVRC